MEQVHANKNLFMGWKKISLQFWVIINAFQQALLLIEPKMIKSESTSDIGTFDECWLGLGFTTKTMDSFFNR